MAKNKIPKAPPPPPTQSQQIIRSSVSSDTESQSAPVRPREPRQTRGPSPVKPADNRHSMFEMGKKQNSMDSTNNSMTDEAYGSLSCQGTREKLNRSSQMLNLELTGRKVDQQKPDPQQQLVFPQMSEILSKAKTLRPVSYHGPSSFYQKRSFTDGEVPPPPAPIKHSNSSSDISIRSQATSRSSTPMPPPPPTSAPPKEARIVNTPAARRSVSSNAAPTTESKTAAILSRQHTTGSSGGWKTGYQKMPPVFPQDSSTSAAMQTPLKKACNDHVAKHTPPPLNHIDTQSLSQCSLPPADILDTDQRQYQHENGYYDDGASSVGSLRRSFSCRMERPSFDNGSSRLEVDLADILEGAKKMNILEQHALPQRPRSKTTDTVLDYDYSVQSTNRKVRYDITGCIGVYDYGFVLAANRVEGKLKKKVYMKVIDRASQAYETIQHSVNPEHTELALMISGRGKHLPEFIEYHLEQEYLVIVTKRHGTRTAWAPLRQKHNAVNWIYYFTQAC